MPFLTYCPQVRSWLEFQTSAYLCERGDELLTFYQCPRDNRIIAERTILMSLQMLFLMLCTVCPTIKKGKANQWLWRENNPLMIFHMLFLTRCLALKEHIPYFLIEVDQRLICQCPRDSRIVVWRILMRIYFSHAFTTWLTDEGCFISKCTHLELHTCDLGGLGLVLQNIY